MKVSQDGIMLIVLHKFLPMAKLFVQRINRLEIQQNGKIPTILTLKMKVEDMYDMAEV